MAAARGLAVNLALVIALLFVAFPSSAQNAKVEAQATALQKKAIDNYVQTEFAKAQTELEKAAKLCESKCGPSLRARLLRDLGVVQIGGALDKEKGIQNFVEALKLDANVVLDPDIRNKDLDAAFAEAKRRAGGAAPAAAEPPKPKPASDQPTGDFQHTPAPSQQIRTPIPIYLEYGGALSLSRVVARYKGFGMAAFQNIELKKIGDKGWGGLIPCGDVQLGLMQYFLTGFDANNDPVATGGDRNNAYKVQVTSEKPADPPHLPNAAPPNQCVDTGDCPPNFPGCKKSGETADASGKDVGELCIENNECRSSRCSNHKCAAATSDESAQHKRFWFGLSGTWDLLSIVPSAQDVCKLQPTATPLNTDNYYCVDASGNDYPSRAPTSTQNNAIVASAQQGSDKVSSGVTPGNIRIMLTADYALNGNLMLGIRFGLVLLRYPGDAASQDGNSFKPPIHLEARATYVLGQDAIWKKGLAGYFMGALGIAPFETEVPDVQAVEIPPGTIRRSLQAWHISGPGFISVGGGARYAISPKVAFLFGGRVNFAFGNSFAPSIGPEIGGQVGF